MTRKTKNLIMWAAVAFGGYWLYNQAQTASAGSSGGNGGNQTMAGYISAPRWRRRRFGQQGGSGNGGNPAGWGNTQDASSFDPLGTEFENEPGYS